MAVNNNSNADLELQLLKSLAKRYPNIATASTEIINRRAILSLPKGTEHFLTDVHGDFEQFSHVLKNGSGSVKSKINEEFGNTLSSKEKRALATLIYYPREKMKIILKEEENREDWYRITLYRLVAITRRTASKYTRSKVRKALPADFAYVIEELITEKAEISDKEAYYNEIINTIISTGRTKQFIIALSELIQRLCIDHLHIVGDIYDRGPGPHLIMDRICDYHSVDIQWGNHDIVWMAAAAGECACICNCIRIAARYGGLDVIEEGYGINLIPLVTLAARVYKKDVTNPTFDIHYGEDYNINDFNLDKKIQKAIAIMQFKLEGQIIKRNPEFKMEDRLLLNKIDYKKGTITIYGKTYKLNDTDFPTIDPKDPYALSEEEQYCIDRLTQAFKNSDKLQRHIRFLYTNGSMYKTFNGNLLYHGCVPLDENGNFQSIEVAGKKYSGKALYDILEYYARKSFSQKCGSELKQKAMDICWYIWCGPGSPVFGKNRMTTFERYFIDDKETHVETKNAYYRLYNREEIVDKILKEFGLGFEYRVEDSKSYTPHTFHSHIVNGHVPVEQKKGESPIKCNGKLLVIDGGFSKAFHKKTGIAGYTLVANSHGIRLVQHEVFESRISAIEKETDIVSDSAYIETYTTRRLVADTDAGIDMQEEISQLEALLQAYRDGTLIEKS